MKSVGVLVGIGVAGVFVGALAMEIIHRVRPNLVKEIQESTKKTFENMGTAFKEGYHGVPVEEKK